MQEWASSRLPQFTHELAHVEKPDSHCGISYNDKKSTALLTLDEKAIEVMPYYQQQSRRMHLNHELVCRQLVTFPTLTPLSTSTARRLYGCSLTIRTFCRFSEFTRRNAGLVTLYQELRAVLVSTISQCILRRIS